MPILGVTAGSGVKVDDLGEDVFELNGEVLGYARRPDAITRATAPFTVTVPGKKARPQPTTTTASAPSPGDGGRSGATREPAGGPSADQERRETKDVKPQPTSRTFPAGSYIVRMDQPYSRIADTLLDYQYWAPDDPQRNPYDDTGWTFGELFNVKVVRVNDVSVLTAKLEPVKGALTAAGGVSGTGSLFAINHNADPSLATLRYRFKDAQIDVAEEPFEASGQKFNRGSFIVRGIAADVLGKATA